jgi:hypothetical protein
MYVPGRFQSLVLIFPSWPFSNLHANAWYYDHFNYFRAPIGTWFTSERMRKSRCRLAFLLLPVRSPPVACGTPGPLKTQPTFQYFWFLEVWACHQFVRHGCVLFPVGAACCGRQSVSPRFCRIDFIVTLNFHQIHKLHPSICILLSRRSFWFNFRQRSRPVTTC